MGTALSWTGVEPAGGSAAARCAECGCVYHVDLHCRSFAGPEAIARLFPGFEVEAVAYLGHARHIASRLFRWLRYALLGPGAASDFTRCPACGSGATRTYRDEPGKRLRRRLFEGLAWRMAKGTTPAWIIVSLRASDLRRCGMKCAVPITHQRTPQGPARSTGGCYDGIAASYDRQRLCGRRASSTHGRTPGS